MELKRTPLYEVHKEYNGKIIDFAGSLLPIQYEGIIKEHEAVRTKAGVFDVSHMGEILFTGKDSRSFINYLITNDVDKMKNDQAMYSPMCYQNGGTVDDILVYRFNEEKYILVVNGANVEKDFNWILSNMNGFDVNVKNISEKIAQIAIQGPKSAEILNKVTDFDVNAIKYYHFKDKVKIANIECLLSRTGYTGEDGFEIYIDPIGVVLLWNKLFEVGKDLGIRPAGLGCRDTLRFEAGMPLYGNELSKDINPIEAGLGMFVKLNKKDFIGKEALLNYNEQQDGQRKIVGFELLDKGIARHGYMVEDEDGKLIGEVTTGYKSPTLDKNIGMALIGKSYSSLNNNIYIRIRKKVVKAKIVKKRFLGSSK